MIVEANARVILSAAEIACVLSSWYAGTDALQSEDLALCGDLCQLPLP